MAFKKWKCLYFGLVKAIYEKCRYSLIEMVMVSERKFRPCGTTVSVLSQESVLAMAPAPVRSKSSAQHAVATPNLVLAHSYCFHDLLNQKGMELTEYKRKSQTDFSGLQILPIV